MTYFRAKVQKNRLGYLNCYATFGLGKGKRDVEYALQIGLIDLLIGEEAFHRGVLRQKSEFPKEDRDKRVTFSEGMTAEDAGKLVNVAARLDRKTITEWLSLRDSIAKRVSEMITKKPSLRESLLDPNAGDVGILKSRDRVRRLIDAAGGKTR